ncbi:MAG: hypothetical protein RLY86_3234 [Pseudomonadota bacterium]|jgi:CBS domain-containing protein
MAQKTTHQQDTSDETRTTGQNDRGQDQGGGGARSRPTSEAGTQSGSQHGTQSGTQSQTGQGPDEARQMEQAASRMGGQNQDRNQDRNRETARSATDSQREAGRTTGRRAAEGGQAMERGMQETGDRLRRGGEQLGDRTREMAEMSADQFDRMGGLMAEAARDAAETARLMMRFSGFPGGGARNLQMVAGGLMDRMLKTQMEMMQRMIGQADAVQFATGQQRMLRRFLESWAEGSAEVLRATRQSVDNALDVLDQTGKGHVNQGQGSQDGSQGREGGQSQRRSQASRPQGRGQSEQDGQQEGQQDGQQEQEPIRIAEVMTQGLRSIRPDQSIKDAAGMMAEEDVGVLPVMEKERLVGLVTDRDIAIRLVGEGKDLARTLVREVMSTDLVTAREDEDVTDVLDRMAEEQLHRIPVVDAQGRPTGIVALADLVGILPERTGEALRSISREGGQRRQGQAG